MVTSSWIRGSNSRPPVPSDAVAAIPHAAVSLNRLAATSVDSSYPTVRCSSRPSGSFNAGFCGQIINCSIHKSYEPLASHLRLTVAVLVLPRVLQRAGFKKGSSTPAVSRGTF